MKWNNIVAASFIVAGSFGLQSQTTQLEVDIENIVAEIQPSMYGVFFEDINFAADGGLYAEMVKNRSFEFDNPKMGWQEPNSNRHSHNNESGIAKIINYSDARGNYNFARISVNKDSGYELINESYRGMGIKEGESYNLKFQAAPQTGEISRIKFEFINEEGQGLGGTEVAIETANSWKTYKTSLQASSTEERAKLKISFTGTGEIDLDMISLFPKDTWKGRENGLRKDLVQMLADLNPGFLRFPGGCIAEGRTLEKRYQWKKTIGPVEEREVLVNRWNTEFRHKFTPDYFQSFGLGYYEYFLLAEDLDAEALPILSVGIACQYNTGEMVPLEDLDPYVQDALDLIEFANGTADSKWGSIRAEMGHPEPFNLKYIGIGNEQWGPEYIERYEVFHKKIREEYPEIEIVSGSGPNPDGDFFEFGWEELTKLNTDIIDEHYYRSPQWFRDNADRYDDYDRNGPKVFAGEYAAHPENTEDGPKENNWEAALSEAAFMTGLERNADIVHLTSYAPLMAHKDAWQWAPDLIWFDNLKVYGTPNYHVQKLYGNNPGTEVVNIKSNGKALTGENSLYASAVINAKENQVIIKVVNTGDQKNKIALDFSRRVAKKAEVIQLHHSDLKAHNSFENPDKILPEEKEIRGHTIELPAYSFTVLKYNLR